MIKRKWFDGEKILIFLLVLLAAAVRIYFLMKFENIPGDAAGNVERALLMLENPNLQLNFNGNSSTLYKYAIASFMYFWRDPVLAPRVFTSLFGIFLVVPYYGTLKILFDRTIAFFSSLVLVFYPLHVIQSSVTTADAVYYFFLFSSLYYFFSYKSGRERFWVLLLSALSFNVASLLRFECWIFIPFFFLLLLPKGKKAAFLFLVLSVVFPCAWLFLNQTFHHDALYSFNAASQTGHASIVAGRFSYDSRPWSWLVILWRSSGASVVIGGLAGIVLAFVKHQKRELATFFLVLWCAFTVSTLAARMAGNDRYSIVLALFLIPYGWFFLDQVLAFLKLRRTLIFTLCLAFPMAGFVPVVRKSVSTDQTTEMFCRTPPGIIRIAAWLKNNVRANENIIIEADRFDVFPTNILIRSGISPARCRITYMPLYVKGPFENKEKSEKYFLKEQPKYLVLNSDGYLHEVLGFDLGQKKQRAGDVSFEVVYEQNLHGWGKYIIYRISSPQLLRGKR